MRRVKLLILGGTSESSALARKLRDDDRFAPLLSLAGRTRAPVLPPVPYRIGGFGGMQALADYIASEGFDLLIDATHPFASRMKWNAVAAAARAGVPVLAIRRAEWHPQAGDDWTIVETMDAAAAALGREPKRAFLTVGQKELAPFRSAPQHAYLIRSVDAPEADYLPPNAQIITARGPFELVDERTLLQKHRIDVLVTKNSGGSATEAKLAAARELGIPVVMVARPPHPDAESVETAEAAFDWLARFTTG